MESFPSNSHKSKEQKKSTEPKNISKVTTGEVTLKKRSLTDRFKNVFFGADFKGVARYVAADVMLPALKNLAVDTIEQGAKRAIYGDSGPSRRRFMDPNRPRISYNTPVDRTYNPRSTMLPHQPPFSNAPRQRLQNFHDIILSSKNDADIVLTGLKDILDAYDSVSVADLYELIGQPAAHTDHMWGWIDLPYINVRQIREGYIIDLPPAQPL